MDADVMLNDYKKQLNEFCKKVGYEEKDLDKSEIFLTLNLIDMKTYGEIKIGILQCTIISGFVTEYTNILEEINTKIQRGLSYQSANTLFESMVKNAYEKKATATAQMIESKVIGEEMIKEIMSVQEKNPKASLEELKKIKLSGDHIYKRVKEEVEKKFKDKG